MAATDVIATTAAPPRIAAYFTDLESRKTLLTTATDLHETLTAHFDSLHQLLINKSQSVDAHIDSFKTHVQDIVNGYEAREKTISESESDAVAKVEKLKEKGLMGVRGYKKTGFGGEEDPNLGCNTKDMRLGVYFKGMDASGLLRVLLKRRKESMALRAELEKSVGEAVDIYNFLLDGVEEFVDMKLEGKAVGMADRRWACMFVLQAVFGSGVGGGVSRKVRERAAVVLEKWKGVLGGGEGSGGVGAGEASMFLQLVVEFGLKDRFDEEFLRKLVVEFAGRRDMPKLAIGLKLGDKIGDIVDELVDNGKEIDAVYFAVEVGLTDRFPPVTLLKSRLQKCKNDAASMSKKGSNDDASAADDLELNVTRSIVRCIEDLKLEAQFSTDPLKKRITQLEKAKTDGRKKTGTVSTSKTPSKRPNGGSSRGGGGSSSRPPKSGRYSNASPSFRQRTAPLQTHQPGAVTRYNTPYAYPSQTTYEAPPPGPTYGVGSYGGYHVQSPISVPQARDYAHQDVGTVGVRSGIPYGGQGSYAAQSSYSAYDYSAVPPPTYPATYKL